MSRVAAALARERPAGSDPRSVEWPVGPTPCTRVPEVFDVTRTALDRAAAAHLCLTHCPKLEACGADRATAPPEALSARVWAGRLDYSSGRPVRIASLPDHLCPTGQCAP